MVVVQSGDRCDHQSRTHHNDGVHQLIWFIASEGGVQDAAVPDNVNEGFSTDADKIWTGYSCENLAQTVQTGRELGTIEHR